MITYTNTEKKFSVLCTLMPGFFPLEIENKCVVKFCGHHLQFLPVFFKAFQYGQYIRNIFMVVAQALIIMLGANLP